MSKKSENNKNGNKDITIKKVDRNTMLKTINNSNRIIDDKYNTKRDSIIRDKNEAYNIIKPDPIPIQCKSLTEKQIQYCNIFFNTFSNIQTCKHIGITTQYGKQLQKDARVRLYLHWLAQEKEKEIVIAKAQVVEKIGQRVLSSDISDQNLATLTRELRNLVFQEELAKGNLQINIKLPDTYNQFFASEKESDEITADWNDVTDKG